MRILVTNDDGIEAPGLDVLQQIASELSEDVWVVAPETDQSGAAHSLTLHEPLTAASAQRAHLRSQRHADRLRHHVRAPHSA